MKMCVQVRVSEREVWCWCTCGYVHVCVCMCALGRRVFLSICVHALEEVGVVVWVVEYKWEDVE